MKIGSLFSGYGGLDMGVQAVLGGETAWFAEFDKAPSKILAHHWPDRPNYGDVTAIDWAAVEPVDVLTGGFPCQDVSLAGARAGIREGTRSGLWSEFARAIGYLNPEMVVIENVRGLLSASAAGPMELDPWSMGDGEPRSVVNALGAVLGDLADLGYDTIRGGVRASDAGAPHSRFRVFIIANRRGSRWRQEDPGGCGLVGEGGVQAGRNEGAGSPRPDRNAAENADIATGGEWWLAASGEAEGGRTRSDTGGRGGAPSTDTDHSADDGERARSKSRQGGVAGNAPHSGRRDAQPQVGGHERQITTGGSDRDADWGPYRPAIERWEQVTRRLAPDPTRPDGNGGAHRLSPLFVEWMMGLPAGHVTAPQIGLTRNEQLKALGNGVVPQQAELAMSLLANVERSES